MTFSWRRAHSSFAARRRRFVIGALGALTLCWGCAPFQGRASESSPGDRADPEATLQSAVAALDEGDFAAARPSLRRLVADCTASSRRIWRRAALLLASAELDTRNRDATPDTAAVVAARVIRQSAGGETDVALARTLYVLAIDRGATPVGDEGLQANPEASSTDCAAAQDSIPSGVDGLPDVASPTTARRLAALQDTLALRTDSLRALRRDLSAAGARAEALEAEIARIRKLLGGSPADPERKRDQ